MKMFILMYKFFVSYAWHSGTQGALAPRISTAWTPLPGGVWPRDFTSGGTLAYFSFLAQTSERLGLPLLR